MEPIFSKYTTKDARLLTKMFNLLVVIYAIARIVWSYPIILGTIEDINSWGISEYLVNFEGGFVRRGLIGQILFIISQNFHLDVRLIIVPVCLFSFGFVLITILRILNGWGLKWWFVALPTCFAFLDFCLIRKDFLNFVVLILILKIYGKTNIGVNWKTILITILTILMLFINEASFFIIVPFLYLLMCRDKLGRPKCYLSIVYICITIGLMVLFLMKTGDANMARMIQDSWINEFPTVFPLDGLGLTIESIGWTPEYALQYNHSILYVFKNGYSLSESLIEILNFFLMIIMAIYVLTNYPYKAETKKTSLFPLSKEAFILIVIFQFCSLLPLFLGLSCDFSRLFMYLYVSAILIVYYIPKERLVTLFPQFSLKLIGLLVGKRKFSLFNNIYIYILFMGFLYVDSFITGIFFGDYFFIKSMVYKAFNII